MSILLDTGVDQAGYDYLSVLIQTLEEDAPRCFFYRILPLGADLTAQGYRNTLNEAADNDSNDFGVPDLRNYMLNNLKSCITDGAATFTGRENGFGVLLSQELFGDKNKLFVMHCAAHRIQLAGRHLVDKIPDQQTSDNQLKSISTFYNQQHSKNLAHITEMSKVLNLPLRSISYIFTTR